MGSLAFITREDEIVIPRPVCAREGDVFEVVRFADDPPNTMSPDGFVVIQLDPQLVNGAYLIHYKGDCYMVRIRFQSSGLKLYCHSTQSSFVSGEYPIKAIKIIGRVVEIYPNGDLDIQWVFYQDGLEYLPSHEMPAYFQKRPTR